MVHISFKQTLKLFLILSYCVLFKNVSLAQYYHEDFSEYTVSDTVSVGVLKWIIGDLPPDFTTADLDKNPHYDFLSFMEGYPWRLINLDGDTVAFSTSAYENEKAANDWMITPKITVPTVLPGQKILFQWQAMSGDDFFTENYQVRLSSTTSETESFTEVLADIYQENGSTFETRTVDISSYAGLDIYISFINTTADGWLLYVDDLKVLISDGYDTQLIANNTSRYERTQTDIYISGTIYNNGNYINSLEIEWNDGSQHIAMIENLNIAPLQSYTFVHPIPFTSSITAEHNINMKILSINGGNAIDNDPSNNNLPILISTIDDSPQKNILFEISTGTWCGYCPSGDVNLKELEETVADGSAIGIKVHIDNDPMTIKEYQDGINLPGAPMFNVDRELFLESVERNYFEEIYYNRRELPSPVSVSAKAEYNPESRNVSISCEAIFATQYTGELRFAAIILEDSINRTTSDYNQANNYSGGVLGEMGGWENLPGSVHAADVYYDRVPRALLGGFAGQEMSIPYQNLNNGKATYTFNYLVPDDFNPKYMNVVVLVLRGDNGEVVNAQKVVFEEILDTHTITGYQPTFKVFPTVCNQQDVYIERAENAKGDYQVILLNSKGQEVSTRCSLNHTLTSFPLPENLPTGYYFINISNKQSAATYPIFILK
ncbi:MAG: choice-of-anchor J domain-containing protein [Saprospiraceae bacterium]